MRQRRQRRKKGINFGGRNKVIMEDMPSVDDFDDRTSSLKVETYATIFRDINYGGQYYKLCVGSYEMGNLRFGNDQLSSLKVPAGLKVTLYEHMNFRGESRSYTSDTPFVGDFNDKTSSIKVEKIAKEEVAASSTQTGTSKPETTIPEKTQVPNTQYAQDIKDDKTTFYSSPNIELDRGIKLPIIKK